MAIMKGSWMAHLIHRSKMWKGALEGFAPGERPPRHRLPRSPAMAHLHSPSPASTIRASYPSRLPWCASHLHPRRLARLVALGLRPHPLRTGLPRDHDPRAGTGLRASMLGKLAHNVAPAAGCAGNDGGAILCRKDGDT